MKQETLQLIKALGEKLGVTGEFLFETLVYQQYVSAIHGFVLFALFVVLAIIMAKKAKRLGDMIKPDFDGEGLFAVIFIFITCFGLIIFTIKACGGIMQVINPEYYAFREILDVFKGSN